MSDQKEMEVLKQKAALMEHIVREQKKIAELENRVYTTEDTRGEHIKRSVALDLYTLQVEESVLKSVVEMFWSGGEEGTSGKKVLMVNEAPHRAEDALTQMTPPFCLLMKDSGDLTAEELAQVFQKAGERLILEAGFARVSFEPQSRRYTVTAF